MIVLEKLTIGYGRSPLLVNADVPVPSGRLVAIVGRNGAGKSTLLRTMAGLFRPMEGRVLYDGCDIFSLKAVERARKIAIVNTDRIRLHGFSCAEIVALGRSPYTSWTGNLSVEDRTAVSEALDVVGMSDFVDRDMDEMSDGECQKIMIARAIAQETPVILLDEPTAYLDYPGRRTVAALLRNIVHGSSGRTVMYSTHDIDLALEFSDDLMLVVPPCLYYGPAADSSIRDRMWQTFNVFPTSRK